MHCPDTCGTSRETPDCGPGSDEGASMSVREQLFWAIASIALGSTLTLLASTGVPAI